MQIKIIIDVWKNLIWKAIPFKQIEFEMLFDTISKNDFKELFNQIKNQMIENGVQYNDRYTIYTKDNVKITNEKLLYNYVRQNSNMIDNKHTIYVKDAAIVYHNLSNKNNISELEIDESYNLVHEYEKNQKSFNTDEFDHITQLYNEIENVKKYIRDLNSKLIDDLNKYKVFRHGEYKVYGKCYETPTIQPQFDYGPTMTLEDFCKQNQF